jgi:Family of unknown function (DUF6364)
MTSKITLTIDSKVVRAAKKRSSKKGVSLSKIIENYLREFSSKDRIKRRGSATELIGIAGKATTEFDYDRELFMALKEKHLK